MSVETFDPYELQKPPSIKEMIRHFGGLAIKKVLGIGDKSAYKSVEIPRSVVQTTEHGEITGVSRPAEWVTSQDALTREQQLASRVQAVDMKVAPAAGHVIGETQRPPVKKTISPAGYVIGGENAGSKTEH